MAASPIARSLMKILSPAWVSRWQFAQSRTHFASSASIFCHERRIPSADMAKSLVRASR